MRATPTMHSLRAAYGGDAFQAAVLRAIALSAFSSSGTAGSLLGTDDFSPHRLLGSGAASPTGKGGVVQQTEGVGQHHELPVPDDRLGLAHLEVGPAPL